jgi:hypothetical protein
MTTGGLKYDEGKLRMDLLPMDSLQDVAAVYTFGAKKYEDENWRKGIPWKRIYGAVLRHIAKWFLGQDTDEESGLPHLAHATWGLLTLLNYARTHTELDDRPPAYGIRNSATSAHAEAGSDQPDGYFTLSDREDPLVPEKGPSEDHPLPRRSPLTSNWSR